MSAPSSTRLILCTLRYSDNLGDGIIGDCLAWMLQQQNPNLHIQHLDMAGRTGYAPAAAPSTKPSLKQIFYHLPNWVRPLSTLAAWPLLMAPKVHKAWQELDTSHPFHFIYGGGQMLSDLALNFPLKFRLNQKIASGYGARIAVSAVGVNNNWSFLAQKLFAKSLAHATWISVRDEQSKNVLQQRLPNLADKVTQTIDPGVWAADVYQTAKPTRKKGGLPRIGIGVSHPAELASHAPNAADFQEDAAYTFWKDLLHGLVDAGYTPVLFTNGAHEDELFLKDLLAHLAPEAFPQQLETLPRATTPAELVAHLAGLDGLISHRLHANIVAYSLAIPTIALMWDRKVASFCALAERSQWCLPSNGTAAEAVALLHQTLAEGVDTAHRDALKQRAMADAAAMLHSLGETA